VPNLHLTDIVVQRLKNPGTYFDNTTPAFGIRVGKHCKTWIVMRGRERRRTRIGHYPAVSLGDARKQAFALLGSPLSENKPPVVSFSEAREKFLETHVSMLKPRTSKEVRRIVLRHFYWNKQLDQITSDDVATAIESIKAKSEAWHAFKDIRAFFRWCVPRYIKHAPTEGLKSPSRYIPRKRVLSEPELLSVWRAADRTGYPFGVLIKLMILTGQRYGELVSLRWEFINFRDRTITLPETKNGRQHTFPYSRMVTGILEVIPRRNATNLLFPGRDLTRPWNGAGKAKFQLEDRPSIKPWTLHDLRRTASTTWAQLRIPPHIVERLLNHQIGTIHAAGTISAVAEVYNRYMYLDEMREAVEKYDGYLSALLRQA
jgi:integrase